MDPEDVVSQIAGRLSPYIGWRRVDDHFELEIRKKAVAQRVNRMGRVVLLYQGNLDWRECLSTYRSRDLVEKEFDALKNDLRLRASECAEGQHYERAHICVLHRADPQDEDCEAHAGEGAHFQVQPGRNAH